MKLLQFLAILWVGTKFIADCYREGKGVSRDKSLAKELYCEAAAAGNKEAKKIIEGW